MKTLKALGLASGMIAAALVGGTLISAVSASPSTSRSDAHALAVGEDAAAYCELWQETFASELGVAVDDLAPAAKAAALATIDAAVENGDLPEDIAERMREHLEDADGDGCRLLGAGFRAWGKHAARVDWVHDWVSAAAEVLGLEPADLVGSLRDGQTLGEIAEAQGVDYGVVSGAILDAAAEDLAALVEAGRITQERADGMLARLAERLEAGEFPPLRDGRPGRGHHGFRGGPAFDGVTPQGS